MPEPAPYTADLPACLDGNCIWRRPKGMHTNGGCKCTRGLERQTRYWEAMDKDERRELAEEWRTLRRGIAAMRDEIERLESTNA